MRFTIFSLVVFLLTSGVGLAQPSEFQPPCPVNPFFQRLLQGEAQINGGLASTNDWIGIFDDTGNAIGFTNIVETSGTIVTTGFSVGVALDVFDPGCPPQFGAQPGELIDIVLWDASTGSFLTTMDVSFAFSLGATGKVEGPDGDENTADLYNFIQLYAPLPVEILYLRGEARDQDVVLEWATTMELNNDYFDVEHSTDGRTFEVIGQVSGQGTQEALQEYSFRHLDAGVGVHYYRLHQFDFDGSATYTGIVPVRVDGEVTDEGPLHIYPNPTQDYVSIDAPADWADAAAITINVRDINGRLLQQVSRSASPTLTFDVGHLPTGILLLEINNGVTTRVERLLKQ